MADPFFSVIIPTYNREGMIGRTVGHVLAQSFEDLELIVVDDGSTDQTEQILNEINDSRLIMIKQENKGRSTARNTGIDAARGRFICFQDSDDIWLPDHLKNLHRSAIGLSEPTFLFTSLIWRFPEKDVKREMPKVTGSRSAVEYVIKEEVSTITTCISRSILNEYKFDPELVMNEDLHLWARIAAKYPVMLVNSMQAVAIQHSQNTKHVISDHIASALLATKKIFGNPDVAPHLSESFKRNRLMGLHHQHIDLLGQQGKRFEQSIKIIQFIVRYPENPQNKSKIVMLIHNLPIIGNLLKKK